MPLRNYALYNAQYVIIDSATGALRVQAMFADRSYLIITIIKNVL